MTEDEPRIDVVAGVITDATGRILLARRTEGRDLAGLWEFPGGKREPGETPEQALIRELDEELGIQVEVGDPIIAVPQRYPKKRLRLDVRRIERWRGKPRGNEGQALAWVPPTKLTAYSMPPADRPVVAALLQPERYLVTPQPGESDVEWLDGLANSLAAGIRRVQLRLPNIALPRRHYLIREAIDRCHAVEAEVLINGDIALAREFDVGVHLRAAQLSDFTERPIAAPFAASCHDQAELESAEKIGCDFVVLGPVNPTPTHPDAKGIGWVRFGHLRETVSLPIYAIGGVGPDDLLAARHRGAQGIASIRNLWHVEIKKF
ncbi:Nudix family hydrolase [Luteimonas panaciterrae]|uniref:Nudix family hydrolase n=1 Tax=Luteimonas panaciterrae TaxID=363885 RepID=UPI001CFB6AAB|nr:Nudix family hydrolase [Luteimonas panaciterrae]